LLTGINIARFVQGNDLITMPQTTMLGAIVHYITHAAPKDFQPMKANFGILPPLAIRVRKKLERYTAYAKRALHDLEIIVEEGTICTL